MNGQVTVSVTEDWLTPFHVEVAIEGRKPTVARFMAAARAQRYALEHADQGLALEYQSFKDSRLPRNMGNRETLKPRRVTPEEFAARHTRVCNKCRESKPLNEFRGLSHLNATRGGLVRHGWSARCGPCEAKHGE